MRSLYETCEPRPEVLQGELREELFAARLKEAVIPDVKDAVHIVAHMSEVSDLRVDTVKSVD